MLPRDLEARTLQNSVSVLHAVLASMRDVPKVTNATANFVRVAMADVPETALSMKVAASSALVSFLRTFQIALRVEGTDDWRHGGELADLGGFDAEAVLRCHYGFVPRIFQAQKAWPEFLAAEVRLLEAIIFDETALSREDKERLLLACAVAHADHYYCALHFNILKLLGEEASAVRLMRSAGPAEYPMERLAWAVSALDSADGAKQAYGDALAAGSSEAQCFEALAVCAVANLLHSLQVHLQPAADFPLPSLLKKDLYPNSPEDRPTREQSVRDDPDSAIVVRVKDGDTEAFADLVRRHTRRVYATLLGLLGDAEEARDVSQEAFLKAFENLHRFEGRSKFSSWLMSIAINTGTEVLRRRRNFAPIDTGDDDEEWRPRQIQEWSDNPEECLAKEEMKTLVRRGVMHLPSKYRVALLVRDVSQLSTEDAADALGLSVPALKARVLRGRLMLREALAPHFAAKPERGAHG